MSVIILINLIALSLAFLESRGLIKNGLKLAFFLVFVISAIRFDYGNDYQSYFRLFIESNRYLDYNPFDETSHYEPGWVLLNMAFKPLGFYGLIIFLAAFNGFAFYRFIKEHCPKEYYWFAVFIYLFNTGFFLIHLSSIRQSFAIGICLFAFTLLTKGKYLKYSALILVASAFHTSAIILLPLVLVKLFDITITTRSALILVLVFLFLFIGGNLIAPVINQIISSNFDRYVLYDSEGTVSSGLGLLYFSILFSFFLFQVRGVARNSTLFVLTAISFMLIPLGILLSLMSRVNMYFLPATIVVYPMIAEKIKFEPVRLCFIGLIVLFNLYGFNNFFKSETWMEHYLEYRTIFTSDIWYY